MINPYIVPDITEKKTQVRLRLIHEQQTLPDQIIQAVCKTYNVDLKDLQAYSQKQIYVEPRYVCYYLLCEMTAVTLSEIGRKFGKDHTNVISGRQVIADRTEFDKQFRFKVRQIKEDL